jgi:salicylate hydroxylase
VGRGDDPVLIVGAGIGGLTAALALVRAGVPVAVHEQAASLSEIGAGIQLSPNASRLLIALGLAEALRESVVTPEALLVFSGASGRTLVRAPLGATAERRYGAPYWVVHRADLQRALLERARSASAISLNLSSRFEAAEETDRVEARFVENGREWSERGRALIGADGLWSKLRGAMIGPQPPIFSGYRAYRTLVASDRLASPLADHVVGAWLSPSGHFVHYPVRGGAEINLVLILRHDDASPGWGDNAPGDIIMEALARVSDRLARGIPADFSWRSWGLFDRPAERAWGRGRMSLLGDAAHPMLPFLAQGGAMAIEDAVVLANQFAAGRDAPAALRLFETARAGRVRAVQAAARRNAALFHLSGPAALARNAVLSAIAGERFLARFDWIYGYRA